MEDPGLEAVIGSSTQPWSLLQGQQPHTEEQERRCSSGGGGSSSSGDGGSSSSGGGGGSSSSSSSSSSSGGGSNSSSSSGGSSSSCSSGGGGSNSSISSSSGGDSCGVMYAVQLPVKVWIVRWRPLELCFWPDQGALPAKGKEYPGLGYKRVRDEPPKTQPAAAQ
ncbi:hypothetical protein QJQ45_004165 [Haematococcus lacustris]|nr:hypothetical protein QJQ45_004165 [Haematococcus lacustris]